MGIEAVSEQIREYNERIEKRAQEDYPQVALVKQVKGAGTLVALTFLLTLEIRIVLARAGTWVAIWDCSQEGETPARASP